MHAAKGRQGVSKGRQGSAHRRDLQVVEVSVRHPRLLRSLLALVRGHDLALVRADERAGRDLVEATHAPTGRLGLEDFQVLRDA